MSNKTVRAFFSLLVKIIFLCIVWGFFLQDKVGENYVIVFFYYPFIIYIPLIICSIGIVLECISGFLENTIRKQLKIVSVVTIVLGLVVSIVSLFSISSYNQREENIQKCVLLDQKYQVQNFVITPELTEDTSYRNIGSNSIALGNSFAYHTEMHYDGNDSFSLEISAYEFQNPPWLYTKKIQDYLEKEYFHWTVRLGYTGGERVEGDNNGKHYIALSNTCLDDMKNYSYTVVLVQDEDNISLLMLKTFYKKDYKVNVTDIIEQMTR